MIRSDSSLRFSPNEVEAYKAAGVDVSYVRTETELGHAIEDWAVTLSEEHPSLLEKIATEMARMRGKKLPPKLAIVNPSFEGSP